MAPGAHLIISDFSHAYLFQVQLILGLLLYAWHHPCCHQDLVAAGVGLHPSAYKLIFSHHLCHSHMEFCRLIITLYHLRVGMEIAHLDSLRWADQLIMMRSSPTLTQIGFAIS